MRSENRVLLRSPFSFGNRSNNPGLDLVYSLLLHNKAPCPGGMHTTRCQLLATQDGADMLPCRPCIQASIQSCIHVDTCCIINMFPSRFVPCQQSLCATRICIALLPYWIVASQVA